jgi:hypothetical protein
MKNAVETIKVLVSLDEWNKLRKQADAEGLTLSGFFRQLAGLSVRDRGGARKGAGRPKKELPSEE